MGMGFRRITWRPPTGFAKPRSRDTSKLMAVYWYRKAAGLGYPPPEYDLGRMLAQGRGALKNETEAKDWFRRAAEKGMREAQTRLEALDAPTAPPKATT
jgi:TPR repeat protein